MAMSYSAFRLILDVCFVACLVWCAHTDKKKMVIKNSTVLCMGVFALMHMTFRLGMQADVYEYALALLMMVPVYICWHCDGMGGGDAKLMAMMCLYLGLLQSAIAFAISFALLFGYTLYRRKRHHKRKSRRRIIFGPALAVGGTICLIIQHFTVLW